ncbi:uncharacterized protein LACBIDRAFT_303523 [Laccaria bicolor S238N-H82]|uniref:Predicted protein n=1 Tax=Laccaria bicolor (strain S238N-H82 / ATCC MYA-4686) TaxID=486041 RepID=B0DJM5_LACBS|nr:uncharacterized protein LACBIDRAFT_303523 [Laccaria bicolor S238N-H82]EDR05234.1 predicted protein [Laccaria bicolor S238N-H82]|eukprot:XP_001884199.1 predicted protein [Laccaria bicolor S238N-H82]
MLECSTPELMERWWIDGRKERENDQRRSWQHAAGCWNNTWYMVKYSMHLEDFVAYRSRLMD